MVRVISGTAGGFKLQTLDSGNTRPTLDRVKEAEFSMIQNWIPGAVVLDLFAGNGALGIEALSRGAAMCYFNDKSKDCCGMVHKNLLHTGLADRAEISCADYTEALSQFKKRGIRFDLVLLDPPYGKMFDAEAVRLLDLSQLAAPCCTVVAEHSVEDSLPARIGNFTRIKEKKYGTVRVAIYRNEV